jgi:hypothetical protein
MDRGFPNRFEDLFDNLRVKRRVAMEWDHYPASTLCLDPMTALGPQPNEAGFQQLCFGIRRSQRGSLGMNFDRGGQNLPAQRRRALFVRQGLEKEFDGLADIGKCLFDRLALRLASLQFRAPRITALLVLFDYDANFARHKLSFYRRRL